MIVIGRCVILAILLGCMPAGALAAEPYIVIPPPAGGGDGLPQIYKLPPVDEDFGSRIVDSERVRPDQIWDTLERLTECPPVPDPAVVRVNEPVVMGSNKVGVFNDNSVDWEFSIRVGPPTAAISPGRVKLGQGEIRTFDVPVGGTLSLVATGLRDNTLHGGVLYRLSVIEGSWAVVELK